MKLRTVLFWTHLTAGVGAGSVILVMAVTGTLLTFQQSVLGIVERSQRFVNPPEPSTGAARLDVDTLVARVRSALPEAQSTTITIDSDPRAAVVIAVGGNQPATMFVNPYTGEVLGTGSAKARAFYRSVTTWHRYLGAEGERRPTARAITGACNAAFLVLGVTGLFIWWPRQWTGRHFTSVMFFRRGLRGKARDFNWHNVIGFWCAPVIIVLTATGMVLSYTWATNLVYTLTGSPRPVAAEGRGPGGRGGEQAAQASRPQASRSERPVDAAVARASLESLVARGRQQVPTFRTMIVRLPAREGAPASLSISDRDYWNSFARSTLTLDSRTGADIRWEPYSGASLGQKARGWMRFAHTGELGGRAGEAVAGLASAGGGFLVYTGIALSLRRLAAWRQRRRAAAQMSETAGERVA